MFLQTYLKGKLFLTYITRILDFLMDGFNMSLQMSLCCSFIFTLITRIFNSFMKRVQWATPFILVPLSFNQFFVKSKSLFYNLTTIMTDGVTFKVTDITHRNSDSLIRYLSEVSADRENNLFLLKWKNEVIVKDSICLKQS